MTGWVFTLIFILSLLIICRNGFMFLVKLFSAEPTKYTLTREELWLLGVSVAYTLTYLIH